MTRQFLFRVSSYLVTESRSSTLGARMLAQPVNLHFNLPW
jgi:hypothetical protein